MLLKQIVQHGKEDIKMKKQSRFLAMLVFIFPVLFITAQYAYAAQSRTIDYMPRDQELEMEHQSFAPEVIIKEVDCANGMNDANLKHSRCVACMDLKDRCPDCCLDITDAADRKTVCKDFTDNINDHPMVFEPATCAAVNDCLTDNPPPSPDTNYSDYADYCTDPAIPGCQRLGCPSGEPASAGHGHGGGANCAPEVDSDGNPTGNYVCDTNGINDLEDSGCPANAGSGFSDCDSINPKYVRSPLPDADCPPGIGHPCFQYQLSAGLRNCITTCQTAANDNETAAKDLDCCRKDSGVCGNPGSPLTGLYADRPGYQNNCTNNDSCEERAAWLECQDGHTVTPDFCCDNLTWPDCIGFENTLNTLLNGMVNGTSTNCFSNISDGFSYDFVAKSNERLMVIWQVQATPEYFYCGSGAACTPAQELTADFPSTGPTPNTYFYTTVKVYDVTNGAEVEVYPNPPVSDAVVNQRSFSNAFTIFAAVSTGKTGNPPVSILTQGHQYRVRLYYLIAPLPNYVLRSKIKDLQLVIMRVRE